MTVQKSQSNFDKTHYKAYLYGFLKWLTISYVSFQLIVFHLQLDAIPDELSYFWMATLLVYTCLKETFRHLSVECGNGQRGEWYAIIVIGTFLWMEVYNITTHWIFMEPYLPLPENMFESALQSMVLLIAAALSSLWFHRKCNGARNTDESQKQ
jgi:hypothetical protein